MFLRALSRVSRVLITPPLRPIFDLQKTFPKVQLVFEWPDGSRKKVPAAVGDSLFDVVMNNNLDIDGFGACDGELACSTCHLILSDDVYNALPNPPSEEELDLLDTAPLITDTSRLGCQVIVSEEMDEALIKIPEFISKISAEKSAKLAEKRRGSSELSEESSNKRGNDMSLSRPPKRIKVRAEGAFKAAETKRRPKFTISETPRAAEGAGDGNRSSLSKTKSVQLSTDLITSKSQPSGLKLTPRKSILKPSRDFIDTSELKAVEPVASSTSLAASKVKKKKLSKNAIKHIKWVKRHRKQTVSRRKRKANLKLARDRPQRDVQDHVAEAIAYLHTWYGSPDTWKYQKIAQLTLIRHAFNHQLIDDDTYELLLHYLAGAEGSVSDRIRSMCQQVIDNNGLQPESPTLPLSIPDSEDPGAVIERAKRMLEFVLPSVV
ncbi:hypothetical protein Aperf_G00000110862 [Anoplocephala perfoliata]